MELPMTADSKWAGALEATKTEDVQFMLPQERELALVLWLLCFIDDVVKHTCRLGLLRNLKFRPPYLWGKDNLVKIVL